MSEYKSDFMRIIHERGLVHSVTKAQILDDYLVKNRNVPCYIGFDATAVSLHVGSLLPIMLLRHWQRSGQKPIVLMGGGTTMVGDPSGKDESRKILTSDDINNNIVGIKQIFAKFLNFDDGGGAALMLNNADWLLPLNYIDFLRQVGQYISVNRMMQMDSVKMRLERENHLSFLEFNYMVLQSYDFMILHRQYGCKLQMGGADQWGNIVSGVDLAHKIDGADLFGITSPLLTTSAGAKMGKSAKGAIWLNPDMLSPYDYWQFWRNTEDADVIRFLKIFTELPMDEINRLGMLKGDEVNHAKIILANETTRMVHGEQAAQAAMNLAQKLFGAGEMDEDMQQHRVTASPMSLVALLVESGFCPSNSDARRQIQGGAVRINDQSIMDINHNITMDVPFKLSLGKKRHIKITTN